MYVRVHSYKCDCSHKKKKKQFMIVQVACARSLDGVFFVRHLHKSACS